MSTYYTMASDEELALLTEARQRWHPHFDEVGVKIAFLLASTTDLFKSPVTHGGYPALATISILRLRQRLTTGFDAELLVDAIEFGRLSTQGKLALLDHELTHLSLDLDKKTRRLKKDDLGRPKLRTRKGDWNAGDGFKEVCQRHGEHAIEFENLRLAFGRAQEAAQKGPTT